MAWELPPGVSAIYIGMNWDPRVVLCIHKDPDFVNDNADYAYCDLLHEGMVDGVLASMSGATDKKRMYEILKRHGVIR